MRGRNQQSLESSAEGAYYTFLLSLSGDKAMAAEGIVTISSRFGPEETLGRLKTEIASHGLTLFAAIDHAKGAQDVGLQLRPTTVLIFGNAKVGTPLMQANQTMGIDLPLKALVWQDAANKTWISYNDTVWLARRHRLPAEAEQIAAKMGDALAALIKNAAGAQ
jgi:uncharacterized protein (DUF302 family)